MSVASRLTAALGLCLCVQVRADDGASAGRAQAILTKYCFQCHGRGGVARGGFGFVLDREQLVARGLVVPGRPADSDLYRKVQKREMPPDGKPRPDAAEAAALRDWIAAGAPALPSPPRTFVSSAEIARLIRADVEAYPPSQRRFLRYVSFAHLYNAGRPVEELRTAEAALSKLVNSLSWHPRITRPAALDPARTVFRLDLRDYRWTARSWDRLVTLYPYRLPGAALDDRYPVRGDWFIATASRGRAYYDLLELPTTDKALERLLQVDVARSFEEETALRAGFNGSGVSRNNRVIERHDGIHGAYWRSYDFSDNTERQNVFENPLGPAAGRHSFRPAGGEIIFHLPNGMQGYFLAEANGGRVEKAPVEIVSDPQRPDKQVEAGLSCMNCHGRGLIPKDDQVRAHVEKNAAAFPADVVTSVRSLYPPARRLQTLFEQDNRRHLAALEAAGVPEGPDPVLAVTLRYEDVADLAAVAAEFGLERDDFVSRLRSSPASQRRLGALQTRGSVQRQLLEEEYARLVPLLDLANDSPAAALNQREPVSSAAFEGHTAPVLSLMLSADGRLVASGGQDHTVRLWDAASGRLLRTLTGHDDAVRGVAVSADGKRLVSGSDDRTVRLWDVATGQELACLRGHLDAVRAVAISADGRRAVSAGQDRTVRIWDPGGKRLLHGLTGHGGAVNCVALAPNGKRALSGGADGTIRLWDVEKGREVARWDAHRRGVLCIAFSPDGKRAVSGGEDRIVRLWDLASDSAISSLPGHASAPVSVAFTADGRRVLSANSPDSADDRFLRVRDAATGEALADRAGGTSAVWCVAFSADGREALVAGTDRRLTRYRIGD